MLQLGNGKTTKYFSANDQGRGVQTNKSLRAPKGLKGL